MRQSRMATISAPRAEARQDEPIVVREDGFDFLSPDYERLFRDSDATAFQHPLWLDAFYRRLAPRREAEKVVITGRDAANGALRFVLPMIRRRKSGVLLLESCDLGVSDYSAPVIAHDMRASAGLARAILSHLPAHDVMRIRPVRGEHVSQWQFCLGGQAVRQDFAAHAAALAPDFARWRREAYGDGFRKMLDRKKKRFFREDGARVRLLEAPGEIEAAIAAIARLRAGRFEGDLIQEDFVARFYAEVAANGHAEGLARTYEIAIGDEIIGYAFGLTHDGRFNYLLIGCDYETHGRHSPGLVLYDSMIEDWIASNGNIFDFTIGDEPFKKEFGTEPTPIYEITALPTWRGRLAAAGIAARGQLRRLRAGQGG